MIINEAAAVKTHRERFAARSHIDRIDTDTQRHLLRSVKR